MTMTTSPAGLNLIKQFEGLRLKAYLCPANVWTIGYGHTGGVKEGDKITLAKANEYLKADIARFEAAVNKLVTVPLTQNQFDALVSFTYNVGVVALKTSTLLKYLNVGSYTAVSEQLRRWNKASGKPLQGLINRREAEIKLFTT